ncbi:Ig-like domain-containing protein [Chondrinema litorale]|uniref:Ig-like domain-containing protein n=1 Tax=Chondrinema litorale TaxID=2994555 RepID=UPI002543C184|nr:Ig-like domain-containing protein [Chondrinema litorale]UZR92527.1 Ig-like domain-containing protein [Chondrinema litorale]
MKLTSTVNATQGSLQGCLIFLFLAFQQISLAAENTHKLKNIKPEISITSPGSGNAFYASDDLEFTVNASDTDGEVVKVEYYSGEKLIGTTTTAPFSFTWTNPFTGMHEITAHAYDNNAEETVSDKIIISIKLNVPPSVSMVATVESGVIQEGENLALQATANDSDGEVEKVEFYAEGIYIGEVQISPFVFTWENPEAGIYTIKSKAIDNKGGAAYSSSFDIKVNKKPQVSFDGLEDGSVHFTNSIVDIPVLASDDDGEISNIEFYVDSDMVLENNSAPFDINWNNPEAGIYNISVTVKDEDGGIAETDEIKVYLRNEGDLPVNYTTVTSDSTFDTFTSIPLSVEPSAGYEIQKVEFYINDELVGEDATYPFSIGWEIGEEAEYNYSVKVIYDAGVTYESDKITLSTYSVLSIEKGTPEAISMQVYPNPTKNKAALVFKLESTQNVNYTLTDIAGNSLLIKENVLCMAGENTFDISMQEMPMGLYILHLKLGDKVYMQKVLKQ